MMFKIKIISIVLLSMVIVACGSGGGSSTNSTIPESINAENAYIGLKNKALLTQSNTMEFIAALFGRGSSDNFIPSSSTETSARISKAELNTLQSQFVLSKISNRHVFKSDNGNYLQRTVNESSNCYQDGSVSITGQLNNSNIGRINFELNYTAL